MARRGPDYEKLKQHVKRIGVYIGSPGLGDFIFITPLFHALREGFPDAHITFIGTLPPHVRPVFDACPHIDALADYDYYRFKDFGGRVKQALGLRKRDFDLIVDTQRKFVPSMLMKLTGARFNVGYSSGGFFSNYKVESSLKREERHTADESLDLARTLGLNPKLELDFHVPDENKKYAENFLNGAGVSPNDRLLGLVPSASEPTRCWPPERFAELATRLHRERGKRPVCLGAAADIEILNAVAQNADAPVIIEDTSRRSVLDSAALIQRCNVVVGNISGPLHIADALGVPCVGLYGPHRPGRFGLLGPRARAVSLDLECSPCGNPDCEHRHCIMDISVDRVFKTVEEILDEKE